jgi:hypothetical protein
MEAAPTTAARKPSLMGRLAAELQRLVIVVVIGGLLLVAGKYYCFDRLDEEIRSRFEQTLRQHYPHLAVSVRSARRIPGKGVEFRGVRIAEPGAGAAWLAEIDEIFAECDTRLPDFLTQPPAVQNLRVARLKLRAERKADGWNLVRLLPLPSCGSGAAPRATVSDASIEFVDASQGPRCSWTLRNIELTVTPEQRGGEEGGRESMAAGTLQNGKSSPQLTHLGAPLLKIRGHVAGDHFEKLEFDGQLDAHSGAWSLRGAVAGLEFSPRLRAALPRELADSLAPLASVRGRTYFSFAASRGGPTAQTPRPGVEFAIEGTIAEGRIDDARLPEPLTDVEASVRFDNRGLRIDKLSARCGPTHLTLNLTAAGYDAASPCTLQLDARQLPLERLPVGSFPAEVQALWRDFAPRGLVDVAGTLQFDGREWRPNLTIRCHDLSLQYAGFPYRLAEGKGTIDIQPAAIAARLRMIGGGQTIECRAEVRNPGPAFQGWIEVQSQGPIPIDEKLLAAFDNPTQRIVRAFRPRGAISFQGRLQRDTGDSVLQRKLSVELHECSIQHGGFPYPIDKVSGLLQLTGDDWLFRNLRGHNDSAQIAGSGSWVADPRMGPLLQLEFTATDVPLADELRQALSPEAQRLWVNLQPRGNLDRLNVGFRYTSRDQRLTVEIAAEKSPPGPGGEAISLSVEPTWFPYRLDNVTGSFRYADGVMQLSNFRAVHNRASISGEATCRVLGGGACRLEFPRLAADRIEIDHDLLAALPQRMGDALARASLQGPLNLLGKLGMTVPPQPDAPPELDWDLSLDLENGRVTASLPVEQIHGSVRLLGGSGAAGLVCHGELQVDSAMVRGIHLTRLQGPFWSNGQRLAFGGPAEQAIALSLRPTPNPSLDPPRQLTADVFGGRLTAGGQALLNDEGAFQASLALEDADLADIARQLAPQHRGLSGRVFGSMGIFGTTQGTHTWRGGGQWRLREADVYELPAMIALLKLLSIQRPDRTAFTSSDIGFRIEGDDLVFDRIDFSGDAISLKGKGRMNGQREIDLKFHPLMGRAERLIPIFRPIVGETGRQFLLIEVTGPLDQPEVKRTVFPRLDAQLEQMFPELADPELEKAEESILSLPQATLERLWPLQKR